MKKEEIKDNIGYLIAAELTRSYENFPAFNSSHEGYAVIKEEIEEVVEEINSILFDLNELWVDVKKNTNRRFITSDMKRYAFYLAYEAIQVAAMAQKYSDSMELIEKNKPQEVPV